MKRKSGVSRRDFLKSERAGRRGGRHRRRRIDRRRGPTRAKQAKRRRTRGDLVLVNGRIHTMDDRGNPLVSSVGDPRRTLRRGRPRRTDVRRRARDRPARQDRRARPDREPHALREPRQPARLPRRAVGAREQRRRRPRAAQGAPRARRRAGGRSSSPRWARARRTSGSSAACPRSPSSMPPCPTGRCSCTRAAAARRASTRSARQFFETVTQPDGRDRRRRRHDRRRDAEPANAALYHLRIRQTFEDKKRSALDAMAFTAQVGVTTLLDQTLVAVATGTLRPEPLDPQPNHALSTLNHYRMYDAWLALHAEGQAFMRLQMNFLHNQGFIADLGAAIDKQLPELRERLKNQFQFFGDDMVRTGAIGEWAAPFAAARPTRTATRYGWKRSACAPRRAGATRTARPAARPTTASDRAGGRDLRGDACGALAESGRRCSSTRTASRACAGACSTPTTPPPISSRA